jgi:hypothetical protein
LGSYLRSYVASRGRIGTSGYDPILGALSPPLRVLVHASAVLVLWSVLLLGWPEAGGAALLGWPEAGGAALAGAADLAARTCPWLLDRAGGGQRGCCSVVWESGLAAAVLYLVFHHVLHTRFRGVSHPGGPREHRIQRQPRWKDAATALPEPRNSGGSKNRGIGGSNSSSSSSSSWTYVTGQRSHAWTERRFAGTSAALTGEPAGRDVWAPPGTATVDEGGAGTATSRKKLSRVDERLVKELASGGREDGSVFNPSRNPNR